MSFSAAGAAEKVGLFLLFLGLRRSIGEDAVFRYFDRHVFGDGDDEGIVFYRLDLAVDAACGHNFVAFFHRLALFLQFFLFLGLGANHKEVEDHENQDHHDPEIPLVFSGLCPTGSSPIGGHKQQNVIKHSLFVISE